MLRWILRQIKAKRGGDCTFHVAARVFRETLREYKIERFRDKQDQQFQWVWFADIAKRGARESGKSDPDDVSVARIYQRLGEALKRREFETNGRTRVIFLNPSVHWFKMTREKFEECTRVTRAVESYLSCCWIPFDVCLRWAKQEGMEAVVLWLQNSRANTGPRHVVFIHGDEKPGTAKVQGTIGEETRLTCFLVKKMREAPESPRAKQTMIDEAKDTLGFVPGPRPLNKAWRKAVNESGAVAWSKQGRRKKSLRCIETPV
jgi:hypothetical protein